MSDFFGEYFAPGAFMVGAGITGFRAGKDLRSKGSIRSAWREQKDAKDFFGAFKRSRKNRFDLQREDLLDAMYFDTGRYRKYRGIQGYEVGEVKDAFAYARGRSVHSLVHSFGLEQQIANMGLKDLSNISRSQLETLLSASPAHVKHLERAAASSSMLGVINMPTQHKSVKDAMGRRAESALESMVEAHRQFKAGGGKTIQEFIEADPMLKARLSPAKFMSEPVNVRSVEQIEKAMAGLGRGDLVTRTAELFEQVRNISGMQMQLLYMNEGAKEFISGVRIASNKAIRPIDVPIVQQGGEIRVGLYGQERMLARRVPSDRVFDWLESAGSRGSLSQSLDTALMGHLAQNFSAFKSGEWTSLLRKLQGSYREDIGRAIMPISSNQALNAKIAQQTVLRNLPFGPQNLPLEQIDEQLLARNIDATSGLSPNQQQSGIRFDRPEGARAWGVTSLGVGTGDDKTLAQLAREKVITSGSRARATVEGYSARKVGDVHAQIRSYAMPQKALAGMLAGSSRFDIGIHEGVEDVAILLNKNIKYQDMRSVRINPNSPTSARMAEILQGEAHSFFRRAATSNFGVSETLRRLRKAEKKAKNPEAKLRIQSRIKSLESSRKVLQTELLGELPGGGYARGSKEGAYFIDRISHIKGEPIVFHGYQERALGVGDKTFGWKRVFTGSMDPKEGQYIAALFEATSDMPEVQAAMSLDDKAAVTALRDFYAPEMKRFRAYMDKTEWKGGLESLLPDSVSEDYWKATVDRFRDIEALDAQGLKKIGWRTMDHASHSMISELSNEFVRLESRINDINFATKTRDIPHILGGNNNILSNEEAARRSRIERQYGVGGLVDYARMRRDAADMQKTIESLGESLGRIGVIGRDGSSFILDDVIEVNRPYTNLANRFDQILLETMEENTTHGMHKWSGRKLLEDLGVAQDMTNANRVNAFKWMMSTESTREKVIQTLQNQLQFGMQTRSLSVGGNPRYTTRSGGPGSFDFNMMRHMRAQGGVMDQLGIEFAGRLSGNKANEAEHIYRRVEAFHKGFGANVKAIPLQDLAQKFPIDSPVIESLFGRNQFNRDKAFSEVRSAFNLQDSDHLLFDLGEKAGHQIYHPQEISSHTGGFRTAKGVEVVSGVDKSTKKIIRAFKRQDAEAIEAGIAAYDKELTAITVGKKQAPSRMYSGKIQGSLRGQAVPQKAVSLFEMAGVDPLEFEASVGIRESQFQRMLANMGQLDNFDERMSALRRGDEAAVLARQPATEMHRISPVNIFSIDEVFRKAARNKTRGMKDQQIINEIMALDSRRFAKNKAEFTKNLNALDSASEKTMFLKKQYTQALMSTYGDHAIFLPKQMEMILGADYDDDQLDLILSRDEHLRKLRTRASFQRELIVGGFTPEEAVRRAGSNEVLRNAAEDYTYKFYQRELYAGLKGRAGGPRASVLTAAELKPGTEAWKRNMQGQMLAAQMEKGYIGQMTNATNFVREVLRAQGPEARAEGRIFSEMLLGVIPETTLKARQHGPSALMNPEYGLAEGITTLKQVISGEMTLQGRQWQIDAFNKAFRDVHGDTELTRRLLKFTPDVIDAVGAGSKPQNLLAKHLKRDPARADMEAIMQLVDDPTNTSPLRAAYVDAMTGMGAKAGQGEFTRHIKNTAAGFEELFAAVRRHKNPAIIGTALAVGTSMLLGSPGTINDSEANAAGARGQHSAPTTPPPDFNRSAPVAAGGGRAIRIRGRTDGDIDTSELSAAIQSQFPGADVSYNMSDYRERINEEYLRRRLLR